MRLLFVVVMTVLGGPCVHAQWEIENSPTQADLRGIHSLGGGVAWASGTNGTVLRTENGGAVWLSCTVPPGAEPLDFRGIQAFDKDTAIVMSSGKGDLSRLYKTTDGCRTWELLFTNPDKDGFWDAIFHDAELDATFVLGDPVHGGFVLYWSQRDDHQWSKIEDDLHLKASPRQAAFAASNSLLIRSGQGRLSFITGGSRSEMISIETTRVQSAPATLALPRTPLPFASGESNGAFSVAAGGWHHFVIVGGDYKLPNQRRGTAALSTDGGYKFSASETPPHGYRSAVAYDAQSRTWITVGPNGSDLSEDDGRTWKPLLPTPPGAPGNDGGWNALSLPFVVGPRGRIGKLRASVFETKSKTLRH